MPENVLLNQQQIDAKLRRMAYEIWERCSHEKAIVMLGIEKSGRAVAEAIAGYLRIFSGIEVEVLPLSVDKRAPLSPVAELPADLTGRAVVLVDDVANSGKTLLYALRPLLTYDLKSLTIAVLVERQHKSFPITPDVVGHAVATTLQDHIEVESKDGILGAAFLK